MAAVRTAGIEYFALNFSRRMSHDVHSIHFHGQAPNERVELLIRRHWTTIARDTFLFAIGLVVPIPVYFYLSRALEIDFSGESAVSIILILLAGLYYLYVWLFYFHQWIDSYLDVWIVTNKRLVDIEQNGLFSRRISELNLSKIQDVTSEVKGKLQTFLDYGNLLVQTAGEQTQFEFEGVGKPDMVAKALMQLHDEAIRQEAHPLPPSQTQTAP